MGKDEFSAHQEAPFSPGERRLFARRKSFLAVVIVSQSLERASAREKIGVRKNLPGFAIIAP
jgi:hypothetical protein